MKYETMRLNYGERDEKIEERRSEFDGNEPPLGRTVMLGS